MQRLDVITVVFAIKVCFKKYIFKCSQSNPRTSHMLGEQSASAFLFLMYWGLT